MRGMGRPGLLALCALAIVATHAAAESDLERVEATLRQRAMHGEDRKPYCYYGPAERRIPYARFRTIAEELGETDSAWVALMREPEDPNADVLSFTVYSPNAPNCRRDEDGELVLERERLRRLELPQPIGPKWRVPGGSEREQIAAALDARRSAAAANETCLFGPAMLRLPPGRLLYLLDLFDGRPGDELALAISSSGPENLSVHPITVEFPARTRCTPPPAELPHDLSVLSYTQSSELEMIEGIMRSRAALGLDLGPECFYGPLRKSISRASHKRVSELAISHSADGEALWRLLVNEPEDPKGVPWTYIVRAGRKPDCAAGDIVERLQQLRERLLSAGAQE